MAATFQAIDGIFGQFAFDVMSLYGCFCRQCAPILKVNLMITTAGQSER